MASYVVTGVARGLGYEWLLQLSKDPNNTVIGLVRDKTATDAKIKADTTLSTRGNVHILEADLTDYNAIKKAAADTSVITGGKLDYLIQNAGVVPKFDSLDGPGALGDRPEEITQTVRDVFEVHVTGTVHLFNLFLPLIQKGNAKKVIAITSGYSASEPTREFYLEVAPFYSASKAAQNTIVAKYHAEFAKDGILFLAVAPGSADVGQFYEDGEDRLQKQGKLMAKFMQYAPDFKGPITTEESVNLMLDVINNATIEKDGGDAVSHFGNKQWL